MNEKYFDIINWKSATTEGQDKVLEKSEWFCGHGSQWTSL